MNTFTETQRTPGRWFSVVIAIGIELFFFWSIKDFQSLELRHFLVLLGTNSVVVGFVMINAFRKIICQIDQQGIRYCIKPFGKWQTIGWGDIDRAYIREFALMGEYPRGFLGTRQGPKGWAYVMLGTYGLQIEKKSGGKILIGTQRPDELRAFLATLPVPLPVNS